MQSEHESFLIEASRAGHGDTQKRIDVTKICSKLDLSQENEGSINRILHPLVAKGYIEEIPNQNEITVTRRGFYYAIKVSGVSPSNFGMVSYEEAQQLSFDVLKHICTKTTQNEGEINLQKLRIGNYLGAYGGATISQIADMLIENNLIRYLDDRGKIEITSKGIREVVRKLLLT